MKPIVMGLIGIVLVSGAAMAGNPDAVNVNAGTCADCRGMNEAGAAPNQAEDEPMVAHARLG